MRLHPAVVGKAAQYTRSRTRFERGMARNQAQRLAGRRVVDRFPVAEGVTAYILAPNSSTSATGAIVAWNDAADPEHAVIDAYLGPNAITLLDAFGNSSSPSSSSISSTPGSVRISIGTEPVFIEGVDTELARLSSPIGLDLGARTPQETAVSIAAEIIALRWGGGGERLGGLAGPIHHGLPAN